MPRRSTDFRKTEGPLSGKAEVLGKLFTLVGQAGFQTVLPVPSNRALHSEGDSALGVSYSVDFALKFLSVFESAFSMESDGTTENVFEPSSPCSSLGSPAVLPPHGLPASLDKASATCSPHPAVPHCSGTAAAPTEGLSRGLGMTRGSGRQAPHRKWWGRAWALGRVCTCTSHEGA